MFRVKLEDRLATVTSAREAADSAVVARELDCEHHLDHLDGALQVCRLTRSSHHHCHAVYTRCLKVSVQAVQALPLLTPWSCHTLCQLSAPHSCAPNLLLHGSSTCLGECKG